jgi:GntR family transcriptional regulator, rspAB operon transcriptional repressor
MFTIVAKLNGENNKEFAYRVIKEAIMTLELQPGRSINEIELAEHLKLSRTPIREVLAKLREEYLVEVIPQVGTNVSKIELQLIEETAFMRSILEKEMLTLACESFPEEALHELKKNVTQQELLIGYQGSAREFHRLDNDIIFRGNKKENVWAAITRISTHYNRMRLLSEMKSF